MPLLTHPPHHDHLLVAGQRERERKRDTPQFMAFCHQTDAERKMEGESMEREVETLTPPQHAHPLSQKAERETETER